MKVAMIFLCFGAILVLESFGSPTTTETRYESVEISPEVGLAGGEPARIKQVPYHAAVLQTMGETQKICGGAIINENTILTAAHCLINDNNDAAFKDNIDVYVGASIIGRAKHVKAAEIVINPNYGTSFRWDYDIAAIKLEEELVFTDFIRAIPIANEKAEDGTMCTISGYGNTPSDDNVTKLQAVNTAILNFEKCVSRFLPDQITQRMICTATKSGIDRLCEGDSGGPLTCINRSGERMLYGIASASHFVGKKEFCPKPGLPSAYTNTLFFADWINAVAGIEKHIDHEDLRQSDQGSDK